MSNHKANPMKVDELPSPSINQCGSPQSGHKHQQISVSKSAKVELLGQPLVRNATGPRTIQGKQRSKFNALKNGFFSKAILLKDESRVEYESLLSGIREDLQPLGKLESLLVENLAVLLWRKRRLIQVESAEVSKMDFITIETLAALQVQRLDYVQSDGASEGALSNSRSLAVVQDAISCLDKVRLCIAADRLGDECIDGFRRMLFENDHDPAGRARQIRECMEISRLTAAFSGAKEKADSPDQLKQVMGDALDAEIKRLKDLYNVLVDIELQKSGFNVRAARIPSQEVSDRLLRYEAHFSREFDRTMAQLERLQRMRKGQPNPPTIKVEIDS